MLDPTRTITAWESEVSQRTALPALLDYVETLEGEIERLKKEKANEV